MKITPENYRLMVARFDELVNIMLRDERQTIWRPDKELDALRRTTAEWIKSEGRIDFDDALKRELGAISENEQKYNPGFYLKLLTIITKKELRNRYGGKWNCESLKIV